MADATLHKRTSHGGVAGTARRYTPIESPSRRLGNAGDHSWTVGGPRLVRTVNEAAALLGISRALAYRLVKTGELHHIRLGRRVLVPYKAILELVEGSSPSSGDSGRGR